MPSEPSIADTKTLKAAVCVSDHRNSISTIYRKQTWNNTERELNKKHGDCKHKE